MRKSLLDILVDPVSNAPLQVEVRRYRDDGDILEGTLRSSGTRSYAITSGIPRLVVNEDRDQKQTGDSFGFKWQQRSTYASHEMHQACRQWLVQRYGFRGVDEMRRFFGSRRRILDAGCGSGFSASFWMDHSWQGQGTAEWVGVDISSAIDIAQERLGSTAGTHFLQADMMQLPFRAHAFDTIFAEGALHHTPSTERAVKALISYLEPGGQILFYVYRKKGPIREFADDHIRECMSLLDPEEAWANLRPLTRLGQALAELQAEVDVPEDIPCLGIQAGRYDVQRLIYWHFAKLYWNEKFSFEENHHVNFDWYHPRYAHRHTEEEIRRWCEEAGLSITHFDAQESGYTVRATKTDV
jgi:arsenite methyltransferase